MNPKPYVLATAVVFSLVALLHLLRLVLGWSATIAGWQVPFWLSWLAIVVLTAFVFYAVRLMRGMH